MEISSQQFKSESKEIELVRSHRYFAYGYSPVRKGGEITQGE